MQTESPSAKNMVQDTDKYGRLCSEDDETSTNVQLN